MNEATIACIGAGYWGRNLVRNFHALGELAWVCDFDEARLRDAAHGDSRVRTATDFGEPLRDPKVQGVVIATPAETHGALVRRALEAGKHVLVEKPLCLSLAEGRDLVRLAEERGRVLMVGHLLWYHPAVLKLQELVRAGALGKLRYIYSNRLNLGRIRREENILWSFAPHDVSVILGLVGEMPSEVDAQGGSYLSRGIADVTVSTMSFPGGVKAHLFVSWLHPFKEQRLVVIGEDKMAVFNDVEPVRKLLVYPHEIDASGASTLTRLAEAEVVPVEPTEPLRLECEHFLESIAKGTRPRTDGHEALRVLEVLMRCQERLERADGNAIAVAGAPP